jgi:hypothetical protein
MCLHGERESLRNIPIAAAHLGAGLNLHGLARGDLRRATTLL